MNHKKTFSLTTEENRLIERLFYIHASYQAYVSVLAREMAESASPEARKMLEDYTKEAQKAFIELRVAQNAVLSGKFPDGKPDDISFTFHFDRDEVTCSW